MDDRKKQIEEMAHKLCKSKSPCIECLKSLKDDGFFVNKEDCKCFKHAAILYNAGYRKIENKTLVELPCKIGDKVYYLSGKTIREETINNVKYIIINGKIDKSNSYILTNDPDDKYDNFYRLSKLDKSVFLTKLAAQAKLKELNEKHNFKNHTSEPDWN